MADSSNKPKIPLTVYIEVPMHKPVKISKGRNIYQWGVFFVTLRDNEQNVSYKKNYDRCWSLLKYAHFYWGDLKEVSNDKGCIIFTFKFDSINRWKAFEKNLQKEVEGATIYHK